MSLRILVVDDDKISRVTTAKQLSAAGYEAAAHESPCTALEALESEMWEMVLTDLRMPGMNGMQFLEKIKEASPETSVIMMTAYGTVATAAEAMTAGVADYLTKPFDFRELLVRIERMAEQIKNRRMLKTLECALGSSMSYAHGGLVGGSEAMRDVFERMERFADNLDNLLITGETGTGKELVARAIHAKSSRGRHDFVSASCAAVPSEVVERELFGHEAGAFTGATGRGRGQFERARGGTLFLDDVDDLPPELQDKLLRTLQDRKFERVGGEKTLKADVRIIAATKFNLKKAVEKKRFRADLLARLNALEINLPALRERREDILLLTQYFLERFARERDTPVKAFSAEASERLLVYDWPGNIRELQHAIEYALAISHGPTINVSDLPVALKPVESDAPFSLNLEHMDRLDFRSFMAEVETEVFHWALKKTGGHQGKAADLLGIPRTTLQSRMNCKGLTHHK